MPLKLYSGPSQPVDEGIIKQSARFAEQSLKPQAEFWEQSKEQPEEVLRLAIAEFGGLMIAEEVGGQGGSAATVARVYEELAKVDLALTSGMVVHRNVTFALSLSENSPLRDRFLSRMMHSEAVGAFCLTEPGAGSDATAIQTLAQEKDGGYVINGSKAWVVNASNADLLAVFVQTSPGSKARGIAGLFMDARSPGIERQPGYDILGGSAMGVAGFTFSDCKAAADSVMFPAGEGFQAAMQGINIARFGICALCNGALEGGLNTALAYAGERTAFGKPIIAHQGLQWMLAEAVTQLEASRLLTYRVAAMLDRGEDITVMVAHAKKFATRTAFDGLSCAMQAMGANGLRREHALARQLAAVRATFYMDGATEIQNIVIGRSLLAGF